MKTWGMLLGWLAALASMGAGFKENPNTWDMVCLALFVWGTACAAMVEQELRDKARRYERALIARGVDPKTCY